MINLYAKLVSIKSPNLRLWCAYEDEAPLFIGMCGRGPNDCVYDDELDNDEFGFEVGCSENNDDWEENKDG